MNPFRAGFSLYFMLWLVLALVPAVWALVESGGFGRLLLCMETVWREGIDLSTLSAIARPDGLDTGTMVTKP